MPNFLMMQTVARKVLHTDGHGLIISYDIYGNTVVMKYIKINADVFFPGIQDMAAGRFRLLRAPGRLRKV